MNRQLFRFMLMCVCWFDHQARDAGLLWAGRVQKEDSYCCCLICCCSCCCTHHCTSDVCTAAHLTAQVLCQHTAEQLQSCPVDLFGLALAVWELAEISEVCFSWKSCCLCDVQLSYEFARHFWIGDSFLCWVWLCWMHQHVVRLFRGYNHIRSNANVLHTTQQRSPSHRQIRVPHLTACAGQLQHTR
jgi:hypothetical protein